MEVWRRTRQQSVCWSVTLITNKCMTIKKNCFIHLIPDDLMMRGFHIYEFM